MQLTSWFAGLSCESLAQLTRQLYSKSLASLTSLAEGEAFDCFCKVVRVEPIRQDFVGARGAGEAQVRCLACFDPSMLYQAQSVEDAVKTITVQADLKCAAVPLCGGCDV